MFFRIKKNFAHPTLDEASYDPMREVVMGSDYWAERRALNAVFAKGPQEEFEQEKTKFFEKLSKEQKAKEKKKKKGGAETDDGDGESQETPEEVGAGKKGASKKGGIAPWCLRLYLRHGDFVVMHGAKIHTAYEVRHRYYYRYTFGTILSLTRGTMLTNAQHQVVPSGKLRYAMTARYVKPELVDPAEHWRGDFTLPEGGTAYNGDLDLPIPTLHGTS